MCESVNSTMFMYVFDYSMSQKMGDEAVEKDSKILKFLRDYFKTQEICEKAVKKLFFAIRHVLD